MTAKTTTQPVPMATMADIVVAGGIVIALYGAIAFGFFRLVSWLS